MRAARIKSVAAYFTLSGKAAGIYPSDRVWRPETREPHEKRPCLWSYMAIGYSDGTARRTRPHVVIEYVGGARRLELSGEQDNQH